MVRLAVFNNSMLASVLNSMLCSMLDRMSNGMVNNMFYSHAAIRAVAPHPGSKMNGLKLHAHAQNGLKLHLHTHAQNRLKLHLHTHSENGLKLHLEHSYGPIKLRPME